MFKLTCLNPQAHFEFVFYEDAEDFYANHIDMELIREYSERSQFDLQFLYDANRKLEVHFSQALYEVHQYLNKLVHEEKFKEIDQILDCINCDDLDPDICLSVASSTLCCKNQLENRTMFLNYFHDDLIIKGEDADAILKGLW